MGMLVEGQWRPEDELNRDDGRFERLETAFRGWVTADGSPGPGGDGGFAAAPGRYHLYVSYACPWAHRTLVVRHLKRLEDVVSVDVVHWHLGDEGWSFRREGGATGDRIAARPHLRDVYAAARGDYTGRVTVPVLWDRERATIVSNESAEIIRMLNRAFDGCGGDASVDLYPAGLAGEIDRLNATIYEHVNNGVYKAGFATRQAAYEEAYDRLFATLEELETRLAGSRYLTGARHTEADWRLFTTLVRFDAVYHGHFKCNERRLAEYPSLSGYLRDLYQVPGVAGTVRFDHIKRHYYGSHRRINPSGIVPRGPALDLRAPPGREHLGG